MYIYIYKVFLIQTPNVVENLHLLYNRQPIEFYINCQQDKKISTHITILFIAIEFIMFYCVYFSVSLYIVDKEI